jgi:uncharacterized DUF497 family protein
MSSSSAQRGHSYIRNRFMVVGKGLTNTLTVVLFGMLNSSRRSLLSIRKSLPLALTRSLNLETVQAR